MRVTNDNITQLNKNEIFVFGSNLKGIHGAGAAKLAMRWGAKIGQGEGLQGKTYALPTCEVPVRGSKLEINELKKYVDNFIEFAKKNKDLTFLVTRIGCGLAGLTVEEVAPLFEEAIDIDNIYLPQDFWEYLNS
jgi:hypothetical protein